MAVPSTLDRKSHQSGGLDEHPAPLRIAIVGAGIGGLAAAIGLRRNGHEVHLYEQSRFANEAGAAVHLAPNANGILRRWGIHAETFGANTMDRLVNRAESGAVLADISLVESNRRWQHPWHLVHRGSLHDHLKKVATEAAGGGTPARLHTSCRVVDVEPDKGILRLESGESVSADVLLGADGIYSRMRKRIKDVDIFSSGKAAFRFLIPRAMAAADPVTAPLVERSGCLMMWFAEDRRVVMYPCNDNELLNLVCIHPDGESHATKSDAWDKQGSVSQLLKVFGRFDPALKALMSRADPDTLRVWQLMDMEKLPSWCAGRMALLGDAAHPFTPHQGQGAGQAIEDAAALSVVLPTGTAPSAVPERLRLYEEIRYKRAHDIQEFSRQAGKDWVDGKPLIDMSKYSNHNFGHDELDHSAKVFERWKWARKPGACWRMPTGFEPFPGRRRRLAGSPGRTFVTASVKFKTSRTFLEIILPTSQFRFRSADSVCLASFSATAFGKVAWLGGGGYNSFGLYIHGVEFVKSDGTTVGGTYLPALFENLADPIVADREELGVPKLFCDVALDRAESSCRVTASWRGAQFACMTLQDLRADDPKTERAAVGGGEADDSILVYRYIPAVGRPGQADAEYACVMPHEDEAAEQSATVRAVARSPDAAIETDAGDWESLLTLHHVTSVLDKIPIYEVVSAKVVEGTGLPDAVSCRRIE